LLRRELRLLEGQLRRAGLFAGRPLGANELTAVLGEPHGPPGARPGGRPRPWPLASDEAWSSWRGEGWCHATYWVAEWPRLEVPPDFLVPLLVADGRRAMAVVMAPVPPGRAMREARSARTADVADAELRSRAGFLPSARRGREADGVVSRESELADGHAEFRFSAYLTASAPDRQGLDAVCTEMEQTAQGVHVDLRRLYGRQAEAFTWTLPVARGLA
jgi:hypothetical protein